MSNLTRQARETGADHAHARFHIICERDVGLFSLIQQAISNIAFALHAKRIPIAYFGRRCSYWTPDGYRGRDTVWEYYFEPIIPEYPAGAIAEHIRRSIEENPPDGARFGHFAGADTFVTSNFGSHRGFGGNSLVIPFHFDDPGDPLRRRASELIKRYVRVRPEIVERAENFYRQKMHHRPIIGVHLRGTDALVHKGRPRWGPYLDFGRYRESIDDLLRTYPEAGIFVASDAKSSVQAMRDIYGDRVVATEAVRHLNGPLAGQGPTGLIMPAYLTADPNVAARSGEEAVIDFLLLSRCTALVHNGSSLARTVLLNVPEMTVRNTILPSDFGRRSFYFIRAAGRTRRRAVRQTVRFLRRWQNRAIVLRTTVSGQPVSRWYPLIRQRWLANRKGRHESRPDAAKTEH